jgi:hypothetical protein
MKKQFGCIIINLKFHWSLCSKGSILMDSIFGSFLEGFIASLADPYLYVYHGMTKIF